MSTSVKDDLILKTFFLNIIKKPFENLKKFPFIIFWPNFDKKYSSNFLVKITISFLF